jgi:hypothetical protein
MSYLTETEVATKQLFEALDYYQKLLEALDPPVFVASATSKEQVDKRFEDWLAKKITEIESSIERQRAYSAQQFSRDMISGSIFQVAAMGIQLEGIPREPPRCFAQLFSQDRNAAARHFLLWSGNQGCTIGAYNLCGSKPVQSPK